MGLDCLEKVMACNLGWSWQRALCVYPALLQVAHHTQKLGASEKRPCSPVTVLNAAHQESERFLLLTVIMHGWMIYGQDQPPHPYLKVTNHQESSESLRG